MTPTHGTVLLRQIRKLAAAQCPSQESDAQLLNRFIVNRDEMAFAGLIRRHGSMVLGVCRGVLRHEQDAEDICQAAFLVLARKAGTIREPRSLSSWLHGVAYRLALKARAQANRSKSREMPLVEPTSIPTSDDLTVRELRVIVHEELHRLPEKYRTPLLLCYWESKTTDESADQLRITVVAFKKRLERARNLLGIRLTRRGLAASTAFLVALLSAEGVSAAISTSLTNSTAQAAVAFTAGIGTSAAVPAKVAILAEGVIRTMNLTKWAMMIALMLLVCGAGAGLGFLTYQNLQAQQPETQPKAAKEVGEAKKAQKADKDRIVGIWRIVKFVDSGDESPADLMIALGRYQFTKEGQAILSVAVNDKVAKIEGQYKLIESGKMDLALQPKQELEPGIYAFDGDDRLTFCGGGGRKVGKRPTEFKSDKESRRLMFVLVRCKPGEEKPTAAEIAKYKVPEAQLREAVARTQSINNLKQIGLALRNYHTVNGSLPAHAIFSKDGKTPLLSWRVALLPFMDHVELYKEFKLDEPWDSPANKKLIGKMPKSYGAEGFGDKGEGLTYWQLVTGPDTLFDGPRKMKFTEVTDGTANTILVLEAKDPVLWTKPADLVLPKEKDKIPPVGGLFKGGFLMVMCDANVRMMPPKPAPALLRGLITPRGGELP